MKTPRCIAQFLRFGSFDSRSLDRFAETGKLSCRFIVEQGVHRSLIKIIDVFLDATVKGRIKSLASLYPWQKQQRGMLRAEPSSLAPDPSDPRLGELKERYNRFDQRVTVPSVWTEGQITEDDVRNFRGDNQFVWQRGYMDSNEIAYALSYYSIKAGNAADLLDKMSEDGGFGALTLTLDGRLVTRDLLDSVGEIDFLRRHTGLGSSRLTLLDIGAGYGRLAHRLHETFGSTTRVLATDAYAASTFLCEYYLAYRKTGAQVLPLDEVEDLLKSGSIDVATNIHSFSECTLDAVEWWTEKLALAKVRYLMVVPNTVPGTDVSRCLIRGGHDMIPIFERAGYRLKVREPRHSDSFIQQFGVDPAQLFLFELEPTAR